VGGDDVERVDPRPEALRHAPAIGGEYGRVDDHVRERDVAHQLEPGEDHAVLPQADDLARGRVQVARVEAPEIRCVVWPAERGERPQGRREPCVEHILLAPELVRAAVHARGGFALRHRDVPVGAVPDGELMAPPELA
jgi:hypothetical protein